MLNKEIVDKIEDILLENYYDKDDSGIFSYEVYADYRDEFEDDTIKEIIESSSPRETFENHFYENDFDYWEYQTLFELLKDNLEEYSENVEDITEWINENVYFKPPTDHYEKQDVLVNILVDTGDGNYDYTCNNFMNHYASDIEDLQIKKESSIFWLLKQQGYTKRDLVKVIKDKHDKNDKFLASLSDELYNTTTWMNALVFSVKMTLGDLIDYLEEPKDIVLDKYTNCGLVDFWNGAGGMLDICLNKEVIIPKRYVNISIDGGHGYSIRSIYGMCSTYWKDTLVRKSLIAA